MAVTTNTTKTGSVSVTTSTGTATAQQSPAGSTGDAIHVAGTVPVTETAVTTDEFVNDPDAGNAVQGEAAGEAGQSPLVTSGLPIDRLKTGVPSFS